MKKQFYFGAAAVAIVAASPVVAQETTSSLRGAVVSEGKAVAGAEVTAMHQPSGTTASVTTNADGSFSLNGLRVGGPFTVKVVAAGYEDSAVTDVFLTAGQTLRLSLNIQQASEIVVTASKSDSLEVSTGPITALSREDIEGVTSLNRDIRDLARRDPFATIDLANNRTIEIAGQNGRLNRFSVDGVQFSDDFGLNNGGLPTARGPVPIDAIEQFSVKVAPFDISEGDFQGGAINVILRSGGNKFSGSGFFSYTNDGLTGSKTRDKTVALDFSSKQYGGNLSGPIIKDKLFFMGAYERTEQTQPFDSGPLDQGFAQPIPGVTQALIDQVSEIAKSKYNYDTLGVIRNGVETDEKFVGKLDWNVNDDHRLSLTYIRNVGTIANQRNTSTNKSTPTLGLYSTGYALSEEVNSGSAQLNSTWSDSVSTELRVAYRDYNRGQVPYGAKTLGEISVCSDATTPVGQSNSDLINCSSGKPRIFFGPDISRHANALNTENLSVDLTTKIEVGNHSLKATIGYTQTDVFNLFVENALGTYYFDSIADFNNGKANRLVYGNAVPSLNPNDGAASFNSSTWTLGVQDDWQVTDTLQVTLGGRVDLFSNNKTPPLNANFLSRVGFANTATFDGRRVFQPRFGFNWEASDRVIVRGGVGVFAGGTPDVFLSNSFSNTGQLTNAVTIARTSAAAGCDVPGSVPNAAAICSAALNNVSLTTIPQAVASYLTTNTASLANAPVNAIDPDLKIARQLRATISVDYEADLGPLGEGWLFGANFLYGNVLQGYTWTDLRSVAGTSTTPDGRSRFVNLAGTSGTNQDLLMTNSTRGRSYVGVARFAKSWDNGLGIEGSYTFSNVTDENAITSTTARSLYNNNVFVEPNKAAYGRSIYEIRNQFKFGVDYKRAFFGDNETRISLFGEYRSGRPYSLTMLETSGSGSSTRGSVFGTVGTGARALLYVPTTSDTAVSFKDAATETAFNDLVSKLGLTGYRGKIVPKNSQRSPNFFKVDLSLSQELPLFVGKSKVKLFADVENVLNMIDKDWGALRQVASPNAASVVTVQCLKVPVATGTTPTASQVSGATDACQQYRYSLVTEPNVDLQSRQSLYGIRIGAKISF
jgi:outer membrane receptor for ferrienterochelin and colicin